MDDTLMAALTVAGLVAVDLLLPVSLGVLAARSNFRYRTSLGREGAFWGMTGAYLALVGIQCLMLLQSVWNPAPEGLGNFVLSIFVPLLSLPGSAISLTSYFAVAYAGIPVAMAPTSATGWLVVGTLAWGFFDAAGLRWLMQSGRRTRVRAGIRVASIAD